MGKRVPTSPAAPPTPIRRPNTSFTSFAQKYASAMSGRNQGREAATAGPRAAARSARFRFGDTVGSHCCPRPDDEHPLQTYVAAAKGPDGEAVMERLFDGFRLLTASTLKPSLPRTASRQCSDYSTGYPSVGAMPTWPDGPLARLTCGPSPDRREPRAIGALPAFRAVALALAMIPRRRSCGSGRERTRRGQDQSETRGRHR